jgi:hypothetical protein
VRLAFPTLTKITVLTPFVIERNAGAPQIALVGKTLVVSFMTDEKLERMWHRNAYVKIISSADGGVTWGNKLTIADKPAAWAGLLALNESNFLVFCEHEDRSEARHVVLAWRGRKNMNVSSLQRSLIGSHQESQSLD